MAVTTNHDLGKKGGRIKLHRKRYEELVPIAQAAYLTAGIGVNAQPPAEGDEPPTR
jgi:hypothetical protein